MMEYTMEYVTVSQMMMKDICAPDMNNRGIMLKGIGVLVPVSDLKAGADSRGCRLDAAVWLYLANTTGCRLMTGFHAVHKRNPEIGTRDDLVHFLANCLSYIDSIEEAVAADCLDVEDIALDALMHKTVVEGEYMNLVRRWCRDNNCPGLVVNMCAFVFCRAMQLKAMKKK